MERQETHAALQLLRAVAMADGTINVDEQLALGAAAEELREEPQASEAIDMEAEAARIVSKEARVATFEAAVALAAVDGQCSPEEHAVLEQLRAALRLDLPLPVKAREERWEERMQTARAAMRSAEIDFLHAIASKRETGLPQEEYEALVVELRRAQVTALHETLDPALEGRPSYSIL